ncbi:hypothetical protein M0R36_10380 [bacterium]|nr:hypothetical protein [bacterium]
MKILIGGLGTLGSNFLFTLLKTNNLIEDWDLTLVDYDIISDDDLKYTLYSNINKSKIVECVRLIYKIHNRKISIIDFFNGKLEHYKNDNKFDVVLDFRDVNSDIENISYNLYYKCFLNHDYGILLNDVDYSKFRYNPKEYDTKPELHCAVKFCKNLIDLIDGRKKINSFLIDFKDMSHHDLIWGKNGKIIDIESQHNV